MSAAPAVDAPDVLVGRVHSWDLSSGVDGPGTRLVFFLSGCPLRCLYCQNPDALELHAGAPTPLAHAASLVRRYRPFVRLAGGGLTISGGEPLRQPEFTRALLEEARSAGLHTAIDTSGFLGRHADERLLDACDLVLLDVKAGSDAAHRRLTGRPLVPTLEFARRLARRRTPVWLRYVLVPGYNDSPEEVEEAARFAASLGNVERVDVLPFHKLGAPKYEQLGIPFPLADTPSPSPELVERVRAQFRARGLDAF